MQATNIEVNYDGTPMDVFHQIRVGRLRLYNAAARDMLGVVQETWKRGTLGRTFLVRPSAGRIIGEEVVDGTGRVIAVFGLAITNPFLPDPKPQQEYQRKLQTLLDRL